MKVERIELSETDTLTIVPQVEARAKWSIHFRPKGIEIEIDRFCFGASSRFTFSIGSHELCEKLIVALTFAKAEVWLNDA